MARATDRGCFAVLVRVCVAGAVAVGASLVSGAAPAGDDVNIIRIGGTGTALGGMQILAKAFLQAHAGISVVVLPSLGSTGGIRALAAGKIDIAVSARALRDTERQNGLQASEYARTPLILATRHDNPVDDITLEQLPAMYGGKVTQWPHGTQLRLILRPETENDIKLLRGFTPAMDAAVGSALERRELYVAINDQDNATALEKIPGSLGVTTLGQVLTERRRIKPLSFNGVAGTSAALRAGTYPYFKSLYAVTGATPKPAAEAFVRFVRSAQGREILESTGHVVIASAGK